MSAQHWPVFHASAGDSMIEEQSTNHLLRFADALPDRVVSLKECNNESLLNAADVIDDYELGIAGNQSHHYTWSKGCCQDFELSELKGFTWTQRLDSENRSIRDHDFNVQTGPQFERDGDSMNSESTSTCISRVPNSIWNYVSGFIAGYDHRCDVREFEPCRFDNGAFSHRLVDQFVQHGKRRSDNNRSFNVDSGQNGQMSIDVNQSLLRDCGEDNVDLFGSQGTMTFSSNDKSRPLLRRGDEDNSDLINLQVQNVTSSTAPLRGCLEGNLDLPESQGMSLPSWMIDVDYQTKCRIGEGKDDEWTWFSQACPHSESVQHDVIATKSDFTDGRCLERKEELVASKNKQRQSLKGK
eukprot:s926_g7.t1